MNISMTPIGANGQGQPTAPGGTRGTVTPPPQIIDAAKAAVDAFRKAAPAQPPNQQQLQEAVERIRQVVAPAAQNLQFSIDKELGRTIVRVMDTSTNEVIRQIPSEEMVAISKALDKLQGLFVTQQA